MTEGRILRIAVALMLCSGTAFAQEGSPAPEQPQPVDGASEPNEASVAGEPAEPAPPKTQLGELADEVERFAREMEAYEADAQRVLEHRYERQRRSVRSRYQSVIDNLTAEERTRRMAAIERFEGFIARYPDNPRYTPDAYFRLAELHFEKSNDAFISTLEAAERQQTQGDEEITDLPDRPDYSRSIELFGILIGGWPNYRNLDGAVYLKGYCLSEMGNEDLALEQFLALVDQFPKSKFAPETWIRIGEFYFDHNQLEPAIAAYAKVIVFGEGPYYDKALYKLAWTYYRNDQFVEAIAHFRELIEYSDEQARKTGRAGSDLRAEAIQYLAVSLQEDDWTGDAIPDEDAGFARVLRYVQGDKAYDVEILRAVGDIFFDNAKYAESVATIRHLLAKFPEYEGNPELHAKMITAYERMQKIDEAFAERTALSTAYGEGSDWHKGNEGNQKVIAEAEEMMEDALIQAATYHHSQAQQLKNKIAEDPTLEEAAIREYELAAGAYEKYLARYPESENAYDLNFFYAECLYYSFRFPAAAAQYGLVRDAKTGEKYREASAFSAILSRQNYVGQLISDGKIEQRASLVDEEVKHEEDQNVDTEDSEIRVIESIPIPEAVEQLIQERIAYFEKGLSNSEDPNRQSVVLYKIGEVYYDYKHLDKARTWFSKLIEKFPDRPVTKSAARNILVSFQMANDWKSMESWAAKLQALDGVVDQEFADNIRTLKVGAIFRTAERLFAEEKYEPAAAEYVRLLDENPGNRFADAALNNAAVAYEKTRRFESATRMYQRLYDEHPRSPFAENALFRVAVNAERFYDFDRSIDSHLKLVGQYKDSSNRPDSLFQAALLQERTQHYRKAAKNYELYAKLYPARSDTAETFYRAARVYQKLSDRRNEIRIYQQFIQRYGRDPKQNERVVEALSKTASLYQEAGQTRAARKGWQQVINEFNRRGLQPATPAANHPARAQFELVELDFRKYAAVKLKGSLRSQGAAIKQLKKMLPNLKQRYAEVTQYKAFEWTLAAFFRVGNLFQLFAEALYDAPIPPGFSPDEEDMYRTQLEDVAIPLEDEAVRSYEVAFAKAREMRVTNRWTKLTLKSLNKYKPADYPLFKEEHPMRVEQPLTPPRLLGVAVEQPASESPASESPASEPPASTPAVDPGKAQADQKTEAP